MLPDLVWYGRWCTPGRPYRLSCHVFDVVECIDANIEQPDAPGPFVDRIGPPKLGPYVFDRIHVLVRSAKRSPRFGPYPLGKLSIELLLRLEVIGSQDSLCHLESFAGVDPLLRVGIRFRLDHRTARKSPTGFDLKQS